MSMVNEQAAFLLDMCRLIQHGTSLGFTITAGELYRTPEQQEIYMKTGRSQTMNSLHLQRLGINPPGGPIVRHPQRPGGGGEPPALLGHSSNRATLGQQVGGTFPTGHGGGVVAEGEPFESVVGTHQLVGEPAVGRDAKQGDRLRTGRLFERPRQGARPRGVDPPVLLQQTFDGGQPGGGGVDGAADEVVGFLLGKRVPQGDQQIIEFEHGPAPGRGDRSPRVVGLPATARSHQPDVVGFGGAEHPVDPVQSRQKPQLAGELVTVEGLSRFPLSLERRFQPAQGNHAKTRRLSRLGGRLRQRLANRLAFRLAQQLSQSHFAAGIKRHATDLGVGSGGRSAESQRQPETQSQHQPGSHH